MKALKSQACVRSVRVRVVELPQFGSLHRHLVVPLDVVPFFFICPAHTGHRGLFLLTRKAHQPPASTCGCHSDGLNTERADISIKTLYPPDLPSLSSKSAVTQTHFLLLTPSLDTPGRKRKDLDATKLSRLDVAIKVITLATVTVKLIAVTLHVGL